MFELLGKPARGKKCDAIEGILDEGKEIMDEYADTPALDAGLLAAAQAVEHYEISRYGTLQTWAGKLGHKDAVKLLDERKKRPTMRSRNWPSARSTPKRLEEPVMLKFIFSVATVTALSSAAFAQSVGEQTGVNSALGIAPKTEDFIKEAATGDMLEIDAAKIAQQKGNADEKQFASRWSPIIRRPATS
jgi:Domain of unknown function (DUF892)/Domain of unknown function (DUF4142)